jgi:hypothetical protein
MELGGTGLRHVSDVSHSRFSRRKVLAEIPTAAMPPVRVPDFNMNSVSEAS